MSPLRKVDYSHRLFTSVCFKGVHELTSFGSQIMKLLKF